MINIILACDLKWGIGFENNLMYHFSADLKRFKELTNGHTVVMGRKTWDSMPKKLPNRTNIVISQAQKPLNKEPDAIYNSIEPIIELSKKQDIWVIGGSEICKLFLPHTNRIELTVIESVRKADTYIKFLEKELEKSFYIENISVIKDVDKIKQEELIIKYFTYKRRT